MAATAVAANAGSSPAENNVGEDDSQTGMATNVIGSRDEAGLTNGELDSDNGEEDIKGTAQRRGLAGDVTIDDEEDGDERDELEDLFGDESEEPKKRQLDDQELDSGDDIDRADRAPEMLQTEEEETEAQERLVMDLEIARQPLPEPSDGEVRIRIHRGHVVY